MSKCLGDWKEWQYCSLAQDLSHVEQAVLDSVLSKKFGRQLLQISMAGENVLYENSPIANKTLLHLEFPAKLTTNAMVSSPDYLSIANESIDALVLHHVLEFSNDPHKVLRESLRVLVSGGQLFIIGFNPFSFWGIRKLMSLSKRAPWTGHYYSQHRVADWLRLLDIKLEQTHYGFFKPPLDYIQLLKTSKKVELLGQNYNCFFGSFYVMVARKQVAGLIPLERPRRKRQIIQFPVAEPTTRNLKESE